ncbi:YqaA family protein [Rhodovibrionaceae bacterium A322]
MAASLFWLFVSAFVAATLFPASSETLLSYLVVNNPDQVAIIVAVATTGNSLGSCVNWLLGRFCLRFEDRRWFPFKPEQRAKAETYFKRYGLWSLLFAWLPLIGDPLTFVAGVLRAPFWPFVLLVTLGKGARYLVLVGAVQWIFE